MVTGNGTENSVRAYTDGSCLGNPGPGGWGALLVYANQDGEHSRELSGAEADTTNNRMELTAVIRALETLTRSCVVDLYTDSQYVKNAFTEGWLAKWKKNGWKTAAKKPVKNQDLWQELDALMARHQVNWNWVKGHAGHPENERVDDLARGAAEALKYSG